MHPQQPCKGGWNISISQQSPLVSQVLTISVGEALAACESSSANHFSDRGTLFLRWGGRRFHFNRFFYFRDANRHDANSALPPWPDTNRPPPDLMPDEFLDIRQVGVRFEFTPAGVVCWMNHRSVLSTDK